EGADDEPIHVVHIFVAFDKMQPFFNMQELHRIRDIFNSLGTSQKLLPKVSVPVRLKFQSLMLEDGLPKLMRVLEIFDYLIGNDKEMISLYSGLAESNFNDKVGVRINEVLR